MSSIQPTHVDTLKAGFAGEIFLPGTEGYEKSRAIWNGMIDKKPGAIARCANTKDVVAAVNLAREHGLTLAVKGGGHNIAGSALCNDGLVIDLSGMKRVTVDTAARRATVQGGALLGDFDAATLPHGLATPLGINSTTGVAGLTLGGGFGWLSRKYGMSVDNLESAEVVTADGQVRHVSASENADLFWAIRGGSGNFGVVTQFEFRLHPVGPDVLTGLIVYPIAQAAGVLRKYRDFVANAPDELSVWSVLRLAPPLPFLPEAAHNKGMIALAFCYAGDPAVGEPLVQPLRSFGTPVGEHIGVQPYTAWQQAFDPLLAPGARNYWKSHNFSTIPDGLIDAVVSAIDTLPSPQCEIFFGAIGGATMRAAVDATAYPNRDALYVMNVHGRWDTAAEDERGVKWARDFFKASAPFATGSVYVNFLTDEETDRVAAAYGPNYGRLASIKKTYDPTNLFCTNMNIKP
ncbi:MAG TPA: FAD-binding oxidoreductase [Candidatus Eisenbacteria bacterium]